MMKYVSLLWLMLVFLAAPASAQFSSAFLSGDIVKMAFLTGATYTTAQDFLNLEIGSAIITGGDITDAGGGQINIAAGTAIAGVADVEIGETRFFDFPDSLAVTLTDDSPNFIYVDYNGGTPQIFIETSGANFFTKDMAFLANVYREGGTTVHISFVGTQLTNFNNRVIQWIFETGVGLATHASGQAIASDALYWSLSAGTYWVGLSPQTSPAFDTDPGGLNDPFRAWYNDGAWQEVTAQHAIDNTQYNDYGTGLATLTNNRYGVHWVYLALDADHLEVVYDTGDYLLAQAEAAQPPSNLPPFIATFCYRVGKIIVQKSAATMVAETEFGVQFFGGAAGNHNDQAGIQGGAAADYYHSTLEQQTYTLDSTMRNDGDTVGGSNGIHDFNHTVVDTSGFVIGMWGDTTDGVDDTLFFGLDDDWTHYFMATDQTNNALIFSGLHVYARFDPVYGGGAVKAEGLLETNINGDSQYGQVTFYNSGSATAEWIRLDTLANGFQISSALYWGSSWADPANTRFILGDSAVLNLVDDSLALRGLKAGETWAGVHDYGGASSLEIPNGTNPTTDAVGEWAWDTDDSAGEFFDGVRSVLVPTKVTKEALIWNPDLITDTVPVMELDSAQIQNGIVIENISVLTSVDGVYNLQFFIFTSADPPVLHDEVDTLVVGASDQFISSNTFEDVNAQTLDVGQRLYILTPSTDIAWIKIKARYHIKDNN